MPTTASPRYADLSTGSEVSLCIQAYEKLKADGVKARVVSMPSWEIFEHQSEEYRDERDPSQRHGSRRRRASVDLRLGPVHRFDRARSSACARSVRRLRSRSC